MKRAERAAVVAELEALPLFSGSSHKALQSLADGGAVTSVPAGWALIQEQTPGDACYVLLEGTAHVQRGAERVADIGPGSVVGEVALAQHGLRNATVVADTQLRVLHVSESALQALLPDARAVLLRDVESHRPGTN